jgi:hypothetical protein
VAAVRPGTLPRPVPTVVGRPRTRIPGARPTSLVTGRPARRPSGPGGGPAPRRGFRAHERATSRATGTNRATGTICATGTIRDTARAGRGPSAARARVGSRELKAES